MGIVKADLSVSLDGFIATLNDNPDRLHQWIFNLVGWRQPHGMEGGETGAESDIMAEAGSNLGATVMGRRMFDLAETAWGDNPPFHNPVYVLTHRPHETLIKDGSTSFTFITGGMESAVQQAIASANGKDVSIAGGASMIKECINVGLLDEIQIHIIPVLLGQGIRLFDGIDPAPVELQRLRLIETPAALHIKYRVIN